MRYNPEIHHRESTRRPQYDYRTPGWYFVTICTKNRERCFGEIKNGRMELSPMGRIIHQCWYKIPNHFHNVTLDAFVTMPNHIHGIIVIGNNGATVGALHCNAPTNTTRYTTTSFYKNERMSKISPHRGSLAIFIRSFKSITTRTIHNMDVSEFQWQRLYHDRIIRNADALEKIRWYIKNNPRMWGRDRNNIF